MQSTLDAASAFLLKHPSGDFARGDLVLAPVLPWLALLGLLLAAAAVVWVAVRGLRGTTRRDRVVLGGLRLAVFLLVGLCLLRPTLVLSRAIAQRNVLAIVYDDSRSMTVADQDGGTRLAAVQAAFGDSTTLLRDLAERFVVRGFRAGTATDPVPSTQALTGTGSRSDLGAALATAREALADQPLAGIVLVSDGAQNGFGDLDEELGRLAARGIPVHTVGVGSAPFARDVGVDALQLPDEVLLGSEAPGALLLRTRGVAGRRVVITAEVGARLASIDTVLVPTDRDLLEVPLRLPATEPGTVPVTVTVQEVDGEATTLNNRTAGVLRVRAGPEKILYVEGEPRPELPFLRRAVARDSALQVVALIRSADGKYLRLGVDDSLELRDGFPVDRASLLRYRGVVLGSVEAGFFSGDQLRMLQAFVTERGGGLLALGGRDALGEGGYAGTPVGEALPLELDPQVAGNGDAAGATRLRVRPNAERGDAGFTDLGREGVSPWDSLPELTVVNAVGAPRAGAEVLLEGVAGGRSVPVLVSQRYGRGHTALFLPQDSWRWQMAADLPPDDRTHVAFWTRLLRAVVDGVPDQVALDAAPGLVAPGEPLQVRMRVADSTWRPRDDALVTVRVSPPDAPSFDLPLQGDLGAAGEFTATLTPTGLGPWRLEGEAIVGTDTLHAATLALVSADVQDPGSMERDDRTLAQVAARTGGRVYDIDALDRLPDEAALTTSGITARAATDLWDAPLVFLLFLLLLGADWFYRRMKGLA
ncbi:MAG: vWA domain-containing protein [Gemmatimonadales bacterium]